MTSLESTAKQRMTSPQDVGKRKTTSLEAVSGRYMTSPEISAARGLILLSMALFFSEGLAIETATRNRTYSARVGDTVTLECEFYAEEDFNLFDYPIVWKKRQADEESQINMMGNLVQPFLLAGRFKPSFQNHPPRYVLGLTITNILPEDNGNYSCEISGPQNTILGLVTHHLFISAQVDKVILTAENATDVSSIHQSYTIELTEKAPQPLGCVVLGGYPAPQIDLFLSHKRLLSGFQWSQLTTLSGKKGLRTVYYTTSKWNSQFESSAELDGSHVKCVVKVSGLYTNTTIAKLSVSFAPRISCEDATAVKGVRRKMCVRCEVRAKPAPTSLYWITDSNGTTVRDGKSVGNISALNMERTDGVIETHLYLEEATEDSFRTYILVAENSLGQKTKYVTLRQKFHGSSDSPKSKRMYADDGSGRSKASHVTWFDQWLSIILVMRTTFLLRR